MKNILFSIVALVIIAATAVSCSQSPNGTSNEQPNNNSIVEAQAPLRAKDGDTTSKPTEKIGTGETAKNFTIASIIRDYLTLKNALVADNDEEAAIAGKNLLATLKTIDIKAIATDKHKAYMDIASDAKENAAHISENAEKIDHQREHLASLSKDISDLIALFGAPQKLYQDHCPMYNDGKGAIWISEAKSIKNPYYGNKMLTCGSVKKEY